MFPSNEQIDETQLVVSLARGIPSSCASGLQPARRLTHRPAGDCGEDTAGAETRARRDATPGISPRPTSVRNFTADRAGPGTSCPCVKFPPKTPRLAKSLGEWRGRKIRLFISKDFQEDLFLHLTGWSNLRLPMAPTFFKRGPS